MPEGEEERQTSSSTDNRKPDIATSMRDLAERVLRLLRDPRVQALLVTIFSALAVALTLRTLGLVPALSWKFVCASCVLGLAAFGVTHVVRSMLPRTEYRIGANTSVQPTTDSQSLPPTGAEEVSPATGPRFPSDVHAATSRRPAQLSSQGEDTEAKASWWAELQTDSRLMAAISVGCLSIGVGVMLHVAGYAPAVGWSFLWGVLAVSIGAWLFADVVSRSASYRVRLRREATQQAQRRFADLPNLAQELIVHLELGYEDSKLMYERSLRSSPVLFLLGVAAALAAAGCVFSGLYLALDAAHVVGLSAASGPSVRAPVAESFPWKSLIETGTSAILLGVMATGLFSQRRDIQRHSLTYFDDMVHSRNVQTVIRMLASMSGWIGEPSAETYVRLANLVADYQGQRKSVTPDEPPKALAPEVVDKILDLLKDLASEALKAKKD